MCSELLRKLAVSQFYIKQSHVNCLESYIILIVKDPKRCYELVRRHVVPCLYIRLSHGNSAEKYIMFKVEHPRMCSGVSKSLAFAQLSIGYYMTIVLKAR